MSYKLISHVINDKVFFIHKIDKIFYDERLFCIFDKDKPYNFVISYRELNKTLHVSPIIGAKHTSFHISEGIDLEKQYRYRFEKDICMHHVDTINRKKAMVRKLLEDAEQTLIEKHDFDKITKS